MLFLRDGGRDIFDFEKVVTYNSLLKTDLPNFVSLEVAETAPGERGNTVTGATKPATLSTGHTVNVPLFIGSGELLKIDTRTGEYVERVKA